MTRLKKGDRVAAIGYGMALHSDWNVVPQNLCVRLPDGVSFEQGSYAMLFGDGAAGCPPCTAGVW